MLCPSQRKTLTGMMVYKLMEWARPAPRMQVAKEWALFSLEKNSWKCTGGVDMWLELIKIMKHMNLIKMD